MCGSRSVFYIHAHHVLLPKPFRACNVLSVRTRMQVCLLKLWQLFSRSGGRASTGIQAFSVRHWRLHRGFKGSPPPITPTAAFRVSLAIQGFIHQRKAPPLHSPCSSGLQSQCSDTIQGFIRRPRRNDVEPGPASAPPPNLLPLAEFSSLQTVALVVLVVGLVTCM